MQKCIQLDAKLKDMDNEIAVNPQYVQKVRMLYKIEFKFYLTAPSFMNSLYI